MQYLQETHVFLAVSWRRQDNWAVSGGSGQFCVDSRAAMDLTSAVTHFQGFFYNTEGYVNCDLLEAIGL